MSRNKQQYRSPSATNARIAYQAIRRPRRIKASKAEAWHRNKNKRNFHAIGGGEL